MINEQELKELLGHIINELTFSAITTNDYKRTLLDKAIVPEQMIREWDKEFDEMKKNPEAYKKKFEAEHQGMGLSIGGKEDELDKEVIGEIFHCNVNIKNNCYYEESPTRDEIIKRLLQAQQDRIKHLEEKQKDFYGLFMKKEELKGQLKIGDFFG